MTPKDSIDTAIGKELNMPAEHVKRTRLAWNEDQVLHAVFRHRIAAKVEEFRNALETLPIDKVAATQAELRATKLALAMITAREI